MSFSSFWEAVATKNPNYTEKSRLVHSVSRKQFLHKWHGLRNSALVLMLFCCGSGEPIDYQPYLQHKSSFQGEGVKMDCSLTGLCDGTLEDASIQEDLASCIYFCWGIQVWKNCEIFWVVSCPTWTDFLLLAFWIEVSHFLSIWSFLVPRLF